MPLPNSLMTERWLCSKLKAQHRCTPYAIVPYYTVFYTYKASFIKQVVATRWAGHLKSPKLQIVMVANSGYTPGLTNFSCRVARCAHRSGEHDVDIISILKEYAARSPGLAEAMGGDFARGHRQASGGIVPAEQFEKLWSVMENSIPANNPKDKDNGEGSPRKKRKKKYVRKNTLENWVKRG